VEIRQVVVVAARHALETENQEGEIEDIETDEHEDEGHDSSALVVQAAEHLGIPVVQRPKKGEACAAEHDVVKVADDEVGVVDVHVDGKRALKKTGQAADAEQEDEPQGE